MKFVEKFASFIEKQFTLHKVYLRKEKTWHIWTEFYQRLTQTLKNDIITWKILLNLMEFCSILQTQTQILLAISHNSVTIYKPVH